MENKPKECKGTGKAKGFGCGEPSIYRKYGLCVSCLYKWSKESKEGKEWYRKGLIKTKKTFEIEAKKEVNKNKAQNKIDNMKSSTYWSTILQPCINEIARLIDHGQPCICLNKEVKDINGGHYISTGANKSLSLNLHNIHLQSVHSNKHMHGDIRKYRRGIIRNYGVDYMEFMEFLDSVPLLNLSKHDLIETYAKARKIRNELKKDLKKLDPVGRILLRNKVNCELNIYLDKYLTF